MNHEEFIKASKAIQTEYDAKRRRDRWLWAGAALICVALILVLAACQQPLR